MPKKKADAVPLPRTEEAIAGVNGLHICWDSFGSPKHPAIFLISGMGAQMLSWDEEFCEDLASRGFYVVRYDNRDSGHSSHLDNLGVPDIRWAMMRAMWRLSVRAPYGLEEMAEDLIGLMDILKIPQAHLVGFSMGGTIAQTAAIEFPDRVLSVTSIGSTTGAPDLPQPSGAVLSRIMRPAPTNLEDYIEHYVETWHVLRAGGFPEEEARDRKRAPRIFARGLYPQGAARHTMAILASGSRRSSLGRVSAPTQIIHGDEDPLVMLEAGFDTANSIPGAKMLILEGMGHSLPQPFWPEIITAISEIAAEAASS